MTSSVGTFTDTMSLKVSELLKEVQLDYSPANVKIVDNVVSSIKESIDKIPEDFQVTAELAPGFVRDTKADKVEFKFKRPRFVEIGGSYSIQCVVKPDVNVDLFLRLPKECFHQKDYLNHRYHAKRLLYLCVIKKHLKSSPLVRDIHWATFQNEARKPVLVVNSAVRLSGNTDFTVRIIPTATSLFYTSKLNLNRNNVRAVEEGGALLATPKYNLSILEDMSLEDNAGFVKKTFMGKKELMEALMLLKVWARQRSSIYAHDCLNGYLISVIMAYLATESGRNRINNSLNAMQIFRVTLDFIANSKAWANGILFRPQDGRNVSSKDRRQYMQSFPVVISDSFVDFNLGFRMTQNGLQELQGEAALTLTCMSKGRDGGFDEIFMTKIDFPAKYDYCIRLNLKGKYEGNKVGFCSDSELWRSYEQKVLSLMVEGFKDRAKFVRVIWRNAASDFNVEDGFFILDREPLLIGMSVNSAEETFRLVTMGPSPEEREKALEFRKFWGDKATLRQFRDGRIAEVVVWERDEWGRHLILKDIAEHVLSRHLFLPKENIAAIVDQLDFSLFSANSDPISFSKSLLKAFDDLSKRLRILDDIPLKISSVQPLASAFRFTSAYPPEPNPLACENPVNVRPGMFMSICIEPLEVMIQLEGSGNWPMDEVALEKTKTAFLLKIGDSLQKNWGMMCTATEDDVDVLMSGFAFRLRILHERGLNLVRKQSGSSQTKQVLSTDRKIFICSQHSSKINGLWGRFPIYGPIVRLAKRWVSAHLLSSLLSEEAIELLVAYLFLKPLPFNPPSSRVNGFLRFLRLLSEYDWNFSALIVDINDELTAEDEKEIDENFASSRKIAEENPHSASRAMFLATAYDKGSDAWTSSSPNPAELRRLIAYATSSGNLLTKLMLEDQFDSYRWECLFRTPLNNYDAVVLLHRDKLPYPHHLLFPSETNIGMLVARGRPSKSFNPFVLPRDRKHIKTNIQELQKNLMVDFDPVRCFINEIEREFPDMFKVWYDYLGGDAIGLTWGKANPKKRQRDSTREDHEELVDVLKAVGEVGKGFVRSIRLLKAPKLIN